MDIGSIIKEQYKVIEHIGRGGMADVWSARDTRLRRLVAIKTIAKGLSADVDPVALFEKEAQTIAAMEHPHILPIYDFGEYEGSLYIVMRFITNGSLEHLMRAGPMEVNDVLKMGENIARALDYAHENNIIHLDLKPPNILLGTQQTPYLADFGLATVLDVEGRARNPGSGTLLYMAPEQIVAEVIDHRADIYSFTIMLYHMLTSRLPFDGTAPLALMQLQTGRTIPDITNLVPTLPEGLNDLLRYGTAQNPLDRPKNLSELMDNFRALIAPMSTREFSALDLGLDELGPGISLRTQQFVDGGALELLEAVDVYSRARQQWAGGQGRFTLGMSPFLLISGYYQDAVRYDLQIDEAGYQMLLRGALEYDTDIEYWWGKLDDNERREVCLHTLRSLNIPARIRALDRLESLRDDPTNPVIPRLIGQALEIERNEEVQIAGLRVLRSRARMMPRRMNVKMKVEPNAWLQSITRLGVNIVNTTEWPESIYTPEIDTLISKIALDTDSTPPVSEFAARTIGRIRSLAAIEYIGDAQREGQRGALQALAFIRDEAPALPNVISRQGRLYAWITNTARRLTDRPLEGILRFVLVLLGGWIGMGELVYTTYRSQSLFTPQRWANALSIGLVFGLFLALTVLLSDEFSRRLERFWQGWLRLLLFGALGYVMSTLAWGAYTWMYLQYTPPWDIMRLAGGGLALGLTLAALLQLRGLPALVFTTVSAYLPMYVMYRSFYFGDYTSIEPVLPLGLIWGGVIGWLIRRRVRELAYTPQSAARPPGTGWQSQLRAVMDVPQWPSWAQTTLTGLAGAGFTAVAWTFIAQTYESFPVGGSSLTWDGVMAMFVISLLIGALITYATNKTAPRVAFFVVALASLLAMEYVGGRFFYDGAFEHLNPLGWNAPMFDTVAFAPTPNVPILYFDPDQIRKQMMLVTSLPMVLAFGLGIYALLIWRDTWHYVGTPHGTYERNGWLTGVLIYGLIASAAIGLFALFSLHTSVPWGLAWSAWGALTWVFLVATWRWTRWGARGVIASLALLVIGGFAADLFESAIAAGAGAVPPLQQMVSVTLHPGPQTTLLDVIATAPILWVIWGFGMVLSLRSAGQRKVWGYAVSLTLIALFAVAVLLARVPLSVADTVTDGGSRLFAIDWNAGAPVLTIQVLFLWGLWSLGLLAALSGVRYRQLWSGIALVGLIIGWVVIVLFGNIAGSYAVLAATHAGLVIYALQPEWSKMEPHRFRWPWQAGTPTAGTLRLPAIPLTAAEAPPMFEPKAPMAGPTILNERKTAGVTQTAGAGRMPEADEAELLRTSIMPNPLLDTALMATEHIVDEEKGAASAEPDLRTLAAPLEQPDLRTAVDPVIKPGPLDLKTAIDPDNSSGLKLPGIRLGQTGPLNQPPSTPRIRLDTSAVDKSRRAETIPPVKLPTDKKDDDPPTVEMPEIHTAQTQAIPSELKSTQPSEPSANESGPTAMPKIKLGTGGLTLPKTPSTGESGPTGLPKIKLGGDVPPTANESGPTGLPKIKLGSSTLPGQSSTTGGDTVPGIKINLSSMSKPPTSGQTGVPKIKLDADSVPPTPPTVSISPEMKAAAQKPKDDDVEDGDFEELPPDKE